MNDDLQELHDNVRLWGAEKGLHDDPGAQFEKLGEELCGELPYAYGHIESFRTPGGHLDGPCRKEKADVKDAIGDSLVVLHQFCAGHNLLLPKCLLFSLDSYPGENLTEDTWGTIGRQYGRLGRIHAAIEADEAIHAEDLREPVSHIVEALRTIAGKYGFLLSDCLEHAWSEIQDREGEVRGNIFVKEEDLD